MNEPIPLIKKMQTPCAALAGIFLILFGTSSRLTGLAAFLFCAAVVLLSEDDVQVICCLSCWMNAAQVFKLSADGASLYTVLGMLFAVKQLIKHRRVETNLLVILLVYALYLVCGMGNEFMIVIKNTMMPLQLYLMAIRMDYRGLKRVSGYFIVGMIIESFAAAHYSLIPGLYTYMASGDTFAIATPEGFIPELRFAALWQDPNFYSIHLLLGILICVLLYARREINTPVFFGTIAVLTYFGAKTLSKSFILMFLLIMAYAYLLFLNHKQYKRAALITLGLLSLIILIAAGGFGSFPLIIERLREGLEAGESLTTGRTGIWKDYIGYFFTNPLKLLFGNGMQMGGSANLPFPAGPHNAYLEILLYIGAAGTFIFCIAVYNAAAGAWKFPARGTAVPLLMTLLMYFFLGMYNSMDLQMELLLVLGYLYLNKDDNTAEEKTGKQCFAAGGYEINPDC